MPALSSLAARRGVVSPSGQDWGASCAKSSGAGGVAAEVASLSTSGVAPLSGARTLRTSWMAESASSVASFDFWGLFAISVVASPLRWTCRRGPNRNDKQDHAADTTPQCRRPARSPSDRPMIILSPWQTKRNYGGNEFFTIVNRLLTIANTGLPTRPAIHRGTELRPWWGKQMCQAITRPNHPHLWPRQGGSRRPLIYLDLVPVRSKSPKQITRLGDGDDPGRS